MTLADRPSGLQPAGTGGISHLPFADPPTLWTGPLEFAFNERLHWTTLACELLAAPVRPTHLGASEAGVEARRTATQIVRSLRPWSNAGCLELRYIWGDGRHLRVVVLARAGAVDETTSMHSAAGLLRAAESRFPAGYSFGPLTAPIWETPQAWTEIERAEEVRQPGHAVPSDVASFYYYAYPLGGSGEAWPHLPKLLAEQPVPGHLSIVLAPTELTRDEREAIDGICSAGQHFGNTWQTYDYLGNLIPQPPDAGAAELVDVWGRFNGLHGVTARLQVAAQTREHADLLAGAVGAVVAEDTGPSSGAVGNAYKLVRVGTGAAILSDLTGTIQWRATHPVWDLPPDQAPFALARMPYFFGEEEAGGLFVLPVPDEQGIPGVARARQADQRRSHVRGDRAGDPTAVRLGFGLDHGRAAVEVALPLRALNRHTLVVGSSGSGKTTTVLSLLARLWREWQVPFLVLEPVKTEYRGLLAAPDMEALQVVCLGRDDIAPLRLNPLEPPPGVRCEAHANALLASLKLALPLPAPLPQLLALAIDDVYAAAGWDEDTVTDDGIAPPSLRDLLRSFDRIFESHGYRGEARNVGVAFRVRLTSLLSGSRGRILDTVRSSDLDALFDRPTVVELDEVADPEDKLLLASLLLQRLRAVARRRGATGGELRHVTVIEEAHRLLSGADGQRTAADSGANLRQDAVRAFCEAIAELRSSGEGFILSSQRPTELAPTAVANTGVRVLHHMEDATDRASVLDDLDAGDLDRDITARLRTGEALVRWPGADDPELVRVDVVDGVSSATNVSDVDITTHMADHREAVRQVLPYRLCTPAICPAGCHPAIRTKGSRVAAEGGAEVCGIWAKHQGAVAAVPEIAELLQARTGGDTQRSFCACARLEAEGTALSVTRADVRGRLIPELRRFENHA